MASTPEKIHGEPSYRLRSDLVDLAVTRRGGQMAPVRFQLEDRWVEPYSIAPWKPKECSKKTPAVLRVLRGDFFCLPFGEDKTTKYVHGETANRKWELLEEGEGLLRMRLSLKNQDGVVTKTLRLAPGERVVYQEHAVEGVSGRYNFGHHAILQFPEEGGPYFVNVSPVRFAATRPEAFTDPAIGEYSSLKVGAKFQSLDKVPLAAGGKTSLRQYPARPGFEDLVMVSSKEGDFAWTAVTLDGYVWISLKDPRVLPSTLFWFSNGGRHYPPWKGKHRGRLGLEEVCSHFNDGPIQSRRDLLATQKIPTAHAFSKTEPTRVRLIQLVHPVPKGFGMVTRVTPDPDGNSVRVKGYGEKEVRVPVAWKFLYE
jgi:hypothetical protein